MMGQDTPMKLWNALDQRYATQTVFTAASDVAKLFTIRDHVSKFNETIDKLEQTYTELKQAGKNIDDDTYLSAINLATPEQYRNVSVILEQSINEYN